MPPPGHAQNALLSAYPELRLPHFSWHDPSSPGDPGTVVATIAAALAPR
ncbi:hypothetical protein [Nocardiopsis chromatogenes]|nr:hypothetical protein [Nocardiopsis chromatogenes]